MPRFAANLTHLWPELPFLDRFDAAAQAGFTAVEVLFPYDFPAGEIQQALQRCGLEMVLINAPPPNYTGGDRGFAAMAGREDRFAHDMRRATRFAQALGVSFIHVMAGVAEGDAARKTMVENLKLACGLAPVGLTLTLEPLCPASAPGYFLNDFDLAAGIIAEVGADNLALQWDSYHAQEITGDALACFAAMRPLIRHIQIGDAPGRGPPGSGVVDFPALFRAIDNSGYDGWVSAEYTPGAQTDKTLGWMKSA
ncbi:hydroxypyruvate isomerase family protein [Pseudosulfitobacter koreensis]|uniref:TIM barrel protein n=1 Tax=Pseudosulfitobacter koreensis TaxID=2968472 RepID=A0ABT1YWQ9_9RHOB|nr:TIM barrel protein [Pseudosulfitobacter koreense]MCR8825326.1 TIM barrel protein [Pseudosulfitobacter koreense]